MFIDFPAILMTKCKHYLAKLGNMTNVLTTLKFLSHPELGD